MLNGNAFGLISYFRRILIDKNIWRLIGASLFIVSGAIYWNVNKWEVNAKPGFALFMFSIGILLGLSQGLILSKIEVLFSNNK